MTPPLSTGTLLRQRYEIQQVLGQGGFGRTYLALDQERFAEPCVVKEFLVPYHDPILIEKSKTLFQREASILHQIQHPQIPRFWAAFEDEQRLFLVQDFIAGKTYRQILEERKSQGKTFSEAEVLEFFNSLLPVLTYIHDRAIIHRDITPENIILHCPDRPSEASRSQGLPVLIDFGAVKEATTHWPLLSNPTQVGKVGYAPTEQLQTGTVHPSSDLYALAATSLALLTGKEPRVLLDSQTLSWCWQAHTRVSPALEQILHRMLAMYPGDRYESAREVLTELQPLLQAIPAETRLYIPRTEATTPAPQGTSLPLEDKHSSQQHSIPRPETALPATALPKAEQFPLNRRQRAIAASVVATLGVATPILWQFQQKPPTPPIDGEVASAPSASHSLP